MTDRDDDFLSAFPASAQAALLRVRTLAVALGEKADADNIGSALQYAAWAMKGTVSPEMRDRLFADLVRAAKRSEPNEPAREASKPRGGGQTDFEIPEVRAPAATRADEPLRKTYSAAPLARSAAWTAFREQADQAQKEYDAYIEPALYDAVNRFGLEKPAAVFVQTAKALADYEPSIRDSYRAAWETGPRIAAYAGLDKAQCLHFFAWRAQWRDGLRRLDSMLNARLYLTELANRIRGESPQAAYEAMRQFIKDVDELPPTFDSLAAKRAVAWQPFAERILADFASYYGLHPARRGEPGEHSSPALRLLHFRDEDEETVLESLFSLAKSLSKSRFVERHPVLMRKALLKLLAVLDETAVPEEKVPERFRAIPHQTLLASVLGDWSITPAKLFAGLLFLDVDRAPRIYVKNRASGRICAESGLWYDYVLFTGAADGRFEAVLRRLETKLRAAQGARPLKSEPLSPALEAAVDQTIARLLREAREAANPANAINHAALSSIRADAQAIEEKLTEAENEDGAAHDEAADPCPDVIDGIDQRAALEDSQKDSAPTAPPSLDAAEATAAPDSPQSLPMLQTPQANEAVEANPSNPAVAPDFGLTAPERAFLAAVLSKSDERIAAAAAAAGRSQTMLVDQLNEKLFDLVGDNILRLNGLRAELEPDYADDLGALLAAES